MAEPDPTIIVFLLLKTPWRISWDIPLSVWVLL